MAPASAQLGGAMPRLKSERERSEEAVTLAESFSLIRYNNVTYIPVDYETGDDKITPDVERKVWKPMNVMTVQRMAMEQFETLFKSEAEATNFYYMVAQAAEQHEGEVSELMINTPDGLRVLSENGVLYEPTGEFIPNYIPVKLNTDENDKAEVMKALSEWVDGDEEAIALLRHLATCLAPHWSAVRYVLLMGDGRNGKSVLMSMIQRLFGWENCSHVTRQDMSKASPVVTELRGKLVNIVYDGVAEYLKDSGNEKSLIAGEPVSIRKLYSSIPTMVQTNALFLEGLNREPKSSDKSSALQARIIRFWFPNVYKDDLLFRDHMLSDQMVGALLALLIDNYVKKQDKAVMLAPTATSVALQLEHMHANSYAMQFIAHLEHTQSSGALSLIGKDFGELTKMYQSWRVTEGDLSTWSEPDVFELFRPNIVAERKSKRVNGKPRKIRVVVGFKPETLAYLESLKGEVDDTASSAVVED